MNLKPTLCALALFCVTASSVSAQQSIGIQAGVGIGRVRSNTFRNDGAPVVRMNLGLSYQCFLSKHLTLGADLLYQQRGWRDLVAIVDVNQQPVGTAQVPFRYEYVALPIKIGYRSPNDKARFGFVRLGVVPGVLLNATLLRPDAEGSTRVKMNDINRTFDLAGLAEAGGGWRLTDKLRLEAGVAFQYSFTSFSQIAEAQHLGLSANFGLRYELGGKKVMAGKTGE